VQLRAYQGRDIACIRSSFAGGARRVLSRSPTHSGKTVQFSTGVGVGVTRGIIAAGYDETVMPVQIASVAILSGGAGL
jgi:hypothetical protein